MTTAFFSLILPLVAFFPVIHLQIFNNTEGCSTATFAAKTVFDFWHESTEDCEVKVQSLLKIHKRISLNSAKQNSDQISDLVDGHVRSALLQYLFKQLIALVSTKSLNSKPDIEKVFDELYNEQDKRALLEVCQKVVDESSLFMSADDILQQILLLTNEDLKLHLLDYLLKKYDNQGRRSYKFLPLLTFGVTSVLKQRLQSQVPVADPSIGRLMGKLPEQLLIIFQSWNYNVSVVNRHSGEYMFAERNSNATGNKRFLFSFLPAKNRFRVKGKFKIQISSSGHLAVGALYARSYSYLTTAQDESVYICLDCTLAADQWWQVLWPNNDPRPIEQQFVLFQNLATQQLLCSTAIVNEDLISISTLDSLHHINDSRCHWQVVKRRK